MIVACTTAPPFCSSSKRCDLCLLVKDRIVMPYDSCVSGLLIAFIPYLPKFWEHGRQAGLKRVVVRKPTQIGAVRSKLLSPLSRITPLLVFLLNLGMSHDNEIWKNLKSTSISVGTVAGGPTKVTHSTLHNPLHHNLAAA